MVNDVATINWKKIRKWLNKRSNDQLTKAERKREGYIRLLQKRYGYTQEKATSELEEHYPKAILY